MKKSLLILIFLAVVLLPVTSVAVPLYLSHQGHILQNDMTPVTGSSNVIFKLYENAEGGAQIWSQTGAVTFDNGYYQVVLGPGTPSLSAEIFDGSQLYLGVTLEGQNEFSPRHKILSVPYSVRAGVSDSVHGEVRATGGLFVDGQEIIDSSGNMSLGVMNVSDSFTLPQGNHGDLPTASEDNRGQLFFAVDESAVYYSNGTEWVNLASSNVSTVLGPDLTSVTPELAEPLTDVTITVNGENFEDGCTVEFGDNESSEVTFINSTSVTATTGTSIDSGVYDVKVTNPNNIRGILSDALVLDAAPVWVTEAGRLGLLVNMSTGDHFTLEATDHEGQTLTYSLAGGDFPPGLSLGSDTGVISGDPDDVLEDTEFFFDVTVEDTGTSSGITRAFSIYIFEGVGMDPSYPGDNCKHILDSGSSIGDGAYWIDPDGSGGQDPFETYCDMTLDGGGWTRCVRMSSDPAREDFFKNFNNYPRLCRGMGQTEMLWKGFRENGEPPSENSWSNYSSEGGQTPWYSFKTTLQSGQNWDNILNMTCRGCSWRIHQQTNVLNNIDVGPSSVNVSDYDQRWWFDYGCDQQSGCNGKTEIAGPHLSGRGHLFYMYTFHSGGNFMIDSGAGYISNTSWSGPSSGGAFEMFYR